MKTMLHLLLLLSAVAFVPTGAAAEPAPESASAGAQQAEFNLSSFDLDFPGGPPHLLIEHLNRALGKRVNLLVPREFAEITIHPFQVREVTLPKLFAGMSSLGNNIEVMLPVLQAYRGSASQHEVTWDRHQIYWFIRTEDPKPSDDSVWFMAGRPAPTQDIIDQVFSRLQDFTKEVLVLNVGHLLDAYSIEDITTAIQIAWEIQGGDIEPELKYHMDTKLLLVTGTQRHIGAVHSVLKELKPKTADAENTGSDDQAGSRPRRIPQREARTVAPMPNNPPGSR